MSNSTVGDAAIAVVRRNTEEVQGKGNWRVFEELFADDFVDHTPQPGTTPDKDGVRVLYKRLRAAFPDFRPEIRCGSRTRPGFRPDERLHGLERRAISRRVGAKGSPPEHAGVVEAERLAAVPVHELTLGAFLPEAAAGILLAGIVARRCIARTIELVVGPGVRGELRVGAGSPEPIHVGSTALEGSEVVGCPLEQPDRAIAHRLVADVREVARRIEGDVL